MINTTQIANEERGYSIRLSAIYFYMHHPADRIVHSTTPVIPVVGHRMEREIVHLGPP